MTTDTFDPNLANQMALAGDYDQRAWPEPVGLSRDQLSTLMSPLHPDRVSTRSQGGASLSYVEAHDIKATLTRIFGFGGYSSDVLDARILQIREVETYPQHASKDGKAKTPQVIAQATVRLTIPSLGCTYTEVAVGHSQQWDIGEACDMALKTAESDALKRCAVHLGTQFGLSLYNNGSKAEIIRVIFEPTQRAMLEEIRQEREAQQRENAAGHLERALGAQAVTDGTPAS